MDGSHRIGVDLEGATIELYVEHPVRIELRGADAKDRTPLAETPLGIVEPLGDVERPFPR